MIRVWTGPHEDAAERPAVPDEDQVRRELYGPQTRSGRVRLTPLFPDEYGRIAGLSDEWIPWDEVNWGVNLV